MTKAETEWLFGGKLEDCEAFNLPEGWDVLPTLEIGYYNWRCELLVERDGKLLVLNLYVVDGRPQLDYVEDAAEMEPFWPVYTRTLEAGTWSRKG